MNFDAQLEQLETAQLVRRSAEEEATYIFKHALTQDAAYDSLLHAQRRAIHHRVAQAYEAQYGDQCLDEYAGILANHYAEAGDDEQALIYATHAGDAAARVYANTEAIALYRQALDAGKRTSVSTAQLIHLYAKRGRVFEVTGRDSEALATYKEMTGLARARGDRALELESLLLQGKLRSIASLTFDRAEALALAEEIDRGEFARALELIRINLQASMEMGGFNRPMQQAFAAWVYALVGAAERGKEIAEETRLGLEQPVAEFFRAWTWILLARYYLVASDVPAAVAAISASQIEPNLGHVDPASIYGTAALGECLVAQGEFERAFQLMDERVTLLRQMGIHQSVHDALFIQAKALRALGKTDQSLELLHQARMEAEGMQARRLLWQIYAALSQIESERGDTGQAGHFRAQARDTIAFIADHTPPEFSPSFLNLPDVRAAMRG